MNWIAWNMLTGERAKYVGMIFGLFVASFLIIQQMSIFCGLMTRTFGFLTDTSEPDLWVMDSKVQFVDDIKPLQDTQLLRVRGIEGVAWAVPLYKGQIKARLADGTFQNCNVIGIDDASMVGAPPEMVPDASGNLGRVEDLRQAEGILVDAVGASGKLAKIGSDGKRTPLVIGDTLELNDRRAVVVGICRVTPTFQSQPVIYTTYSRAMNFAPRERKLLSFVLVKAQKGVKVIDLAERIRQQTGLQVRPQRASDTPGGFFDTFKGKTVMYFMANTGIPINFGISVVLGFVVGTAISGLLFYQFAQDNLKHFGSLKAMGAGNGLLLRMILLQSLTVGLIGYGLGAGAAAWMGRSAGETELAFFMPWWVLAGGGAAIILICILSALLAIIKVVRLEPAIVFKS